MKKIETLVIRGRRWFQKLYGNTYHTVTVVVNGHVLKSNIQYGYGTQYLVTAADLSVKMDMIFQKITWKH